MNYLKLLLFLSLGFHVSAQKNVRAWYAKGQVWVVWELSDSLPETYSIYAHPSSFTDASKALLVGRIFKEEYLPGALKQQVDISATYKIPNSNGGKYQLLPKEGLFVFTPHQAGSLWFAVAENEDKKVEASQNITAKAITFKYDPINEPVECHLQYTEVSSPGFITQSYYMWADGRQNQWDGRPDFPIMANKAKNGMPSMFLVSASVNIDTTKSIPEVVWLSGGECAARQNVPDGREIVNIKPKDGILVSHNDDLFGHLLNYLGQFETSSRHIGWRKNYDPFSMDNAPKEIDTVVNYTQRRYIWIDEWLIKNFHVDPTRIHINGHSLGAKGAASISKAYPDHYASTTMFNIGFLEDEPPSLADIFFGPSKLFYPTNIVNRDGITITYPNLSNITDRNSIERDLPFMRVFHGKSDDNSGSAWDSYVVHQFYESDSIGWGVQIYWGERGHNIETGPEYNDHWHMGNNPNQQTIVDDASYEELKFRSRQSFPAFYNHHLESDNKLPGDGTPGIGPKGVGDDWGTWGGYHRWESEKVVDQKNLWSVVVWLESKAIFDHDNCPVNSLFADLAIRKPQAFLPTEGSLLNWNVKDNDTGIILVSGKTTVGVDGLVRIPQIEVFREDIRKIKISVIDPTVGTEQIPDTEFSDLVLY
jgi:pimeloyl-ACP methyl ester carboxylesterase